MKFSALHTQYGGMTAPAYKLTVGGKTLPLGEDVRLLRAECTLTCRQQAGALEVQAVLNPDGPNGSVWLQALAPGASCSFWLGYGKKLTQVFCGFLLECSWEDPLTQGAMVVEAVFLDVRGQLMLRSNADAGSARTLGQMVQAVLTQDCCARMAPKTRIVPPPQDWNLPARRLGDTDYQAVCRAAAFLCYEFYAWADTLYFGPARPETRPVVTFAGPDGLLQLQRFRTLADQCAAVVVTGADENGRRLRARAARRKDSGFGTGRMASALGGDLVQPEPGVWTMAQAQALAKARMARRQNQAGGAQGRSLGAPELRPGRFVEISGLSQPVNGSYYLHTVRHLLDSSGYETHWEAEG